jgi:hypothetical protein
MSTAFMMIVHTYDEHPGMKAMFIEEWHCEQVKTDKEQCIPIDDYIGLFNKEEKL